MENEFVVLSQKRHLAAIGCAALRLVLRALIEAAESAEMTGTADGANLERLVMEKPRRERYEALVTRLEPSDLAN